MTEYDLYQYPLEACSKDYLILFIWLSLSIISVLTRSLVILLEQITLILKTPKFRILVMKHFQTCLLILYFCNIKINLPRPYGWNSLINWSLVLGFNVVISFFQFVEELDKACEGDGCKISQIEDLFNDKGMSNYLVVFLR